MQPLSNHTPDTSTEEQQSPQALLQFPEEFHEQVTNVAEQLAHYQSSLPPEHCPVFHGLCLDIHHGFGATTLGTPFTQAHRWQRYRPKWLDNTQWEELLGMDANNHHHGLLTYTMTRHYLRYLQPEHYSSTEKIHLLLTALTHDWAESVHGDVSHDFKSQEGELAENNALQYLLSHTLQNQSLINHLLTIKSGDTATPLAQVFQHIEQWGYLRTGLRAWRVAIGDTESTSALSLGHQAALYQHLLWLSTNVLGNNIPPVLSQLPADNAIIRYLQSNKDLITHIFHIIPSDHRSFSLYEGDSKITAQKKYAAAQAEWKKALPTL